MKITFLCLTLGSLLFGASAFAQQNNAEVFDRIPSHLSFGTYLGKSDFLKRCSLILAPSDKGGVIAVVKKTSFFDVLGTNDKTLASIHVLPTDDLSVSPVGSPSESESSLSFGYKEGALTITSEKNFVTIKVIEVQDQKTVEASCRIKRSSL